MKLHNDKLYFKELLKRLNFKSRYDAKFLEMDYYITLILWDFARERDNIKTYFTDEVVLYKGLNNYIRLFDDIKLLIEVKIPLTDYKENDICTNLLRNITTSEPTSINATYGYSSIIETYDVHANHHYSSNIEIEVTPFFNEPFEQIEVIPLVYLEASKEDKIMLSERYNVIPFFINTVKIEKIFLNKLIKAEIDYRNNLLFETSQDLYDINFLITQDKVEKILRDNELMEFYFKRSGISQEYKRIMKSFGKSSLLENLHKDKDLKDNYDLFHSRYVIEYNNLSSFTEISKNIDTMGKLLSKLSI